MPDSPLVRLFLDAVRVDAVSLKERPMADFVRARLSGLPVRIVEDGAATSCGGSTGNLICVPENLVPGAPVIALFAHLDTPRPTEGVRPILLADRITSDGSTILGVDNRAGVAALLHALREHLRSGLTGNMIVVFTIGEELGLYGSKFFDPREWGVSFGFVFDCSRRPGTFIRSAVGCSLFTATVHGTSSHAGVAPEKGVNAIAIAAKAVSAIRLGRLDQQMTASVGKISGGEATNVVPDRCIVEGEVRSFDGAQIAAYLQSVQQAFDTAAGAAGGRVGFDVAEDFRPFVLDPASEVYRWTTETLGALGLEPAGIEYLGGSDANMLNASGLPAVNLGIGAQNPHANDEFILLEDLHTTAEIAAALIRRSSGALS
jgi:tripeptide aminopeptidase